MFEILPNWRNQNNIFNWWLIKKCDDKRTPTFKKKNQDFSIVLPEQYLILERIGKGSFGEIYKVVDKNNSKMFAIKVETKNDEKIETDVKSSQGMLQKEFKIMQIL